MTFLSTLDTRWVAFGLWGIGTVLIYLFVLIKRRRSYTLHHDRRARRDFVEAAGLFLVALSAAASVWLVLFGTPGTGFRGIFVAVSLGAFSGVGIVMATERPEPDPAETR